MDYIHETNEMEKNEQKRYVLSISCRFFIVDSLFLLQRCVHRYTLTVVIMITVTSTPLVVRQEVHPVCKNLRISSLPKILLWKPFGGLGCNSE